MRKLDTSLHLIYALMQSLDITLRSPVSLFPLCLSLFLYLHRITRKGGLILIYAWAIEQVCILHVLCVCV